MEPGIEATGCECELLYIYVCVYVVYFWVFLGFSATAVVEVNAEYKIATVHNVNK